MPTIELFENGNSRLSQPFISSLGMFGLGEYALSGDELTIMQNSFTAVFAFSDNGDTLTIKSTDLPYTNVGTICKYQSKSDYLSQYETAPGNALTVADLRELAKKANALTLADFKQYAHVVIDPDYYVFDVEGAYTLAVVYAADGNAV
jgi:hypothetical protein